MNEFEKLLGKEFVYGDDTFRFMSKPIVFSMMESHIFKVDKGEDFRAMMKYVKIQENWLVENGHVITDENGVESMVNYKDNPEFVMESIVDGLNLAMEKIERCLK